MTQLADEWIPWYEIIVSTDDTIASVQHHRRLLVMTIPLTLNTVRVTPIQPL